MSRKSIGLFLDASALFSTVRHNLRRGHIDFGEVKRQISELGDVRYGKIYVSDLDGKSSKFCAKLGSLGYIVQAESIVIRGEEKDIIYPKWPVQLTIDVLDTYESLDILVLGVNDVAYLPLIERLRSKVKTVILLGCNPNKTLANSVNEVFQIHSKMLLNHETDKTE